MSHRPEATPLTIEVVDLLPLVPAIEAGARALRERQRWAHRVAFLRITADEAEADALALERFAHRIDPRLARER